VRGTGGPDGSLMLVVNALERVQVLRDPHSRRLCLDLLAEQLGFSLPVEFFPATRQHLFSIVLACRSHRAALPAFLMVLEQLEPGSSAVDGVRKVLDDMSVAELLPARDRERLLDIFSQVSCSHIAELCRAAAGPVVAEPPENDGSLTEVLAYLEDLNARADGLPPLLVFVEYLARHIVGMSSDSLHEWNDKQARKMNLLNQLRAVRYHNVDLVAAHGERETVAYLVLRIERHGLHREIYVLANWRQIDPNGWYPQRGVNFTGTLAEVEAKVADLVEEAEVHWARYAASIRVEFLLPHDLLNVPVDQWKLEASSDLPQPLGLRYQVVVRSLERARTRRWHREWRLRWARLLAAQNGDSSRTTTFWCGSLKTGDLKELEASLAVRQELVSLVLSTPPPPDQAGSVDQVVVGLRNGLPVMLWHRADGSSRAFDSVMGRLLDAPVDLPEQIRLLRGHPQRGNKPAARLAGHVSLLFDDPDRLVEPLDLPTAPTAEEVPAR
jgi:hypothetical protein